jgi:hypothetical protein
MNRFLKLLGYRNRREYRGEDFRVSIEPVHREVISVIHTRQGITLSLSAERIGGKWEGIGVHIPQEVDAAQIPQLVTDLETAFQAMRYGYVIARKAGIEIVAQPEKQAAIAELRDMGYEIEILPDGKIRQTWRAGAPRQDRETLRRTAPRMVSLIQALHGKRQRFEILAKSKEY